MPPDESVAEVAGPFEPLTELPFPPLSRQHIRRCAYEYWYPRLRSHSPKARLIPLTDAFLDYLRADGIVLPPNPDHGQVGEDTHEDDSGYSEMSGSEEDDESEQEDPSEAWREIHVKIRDVIAELGGKVTPKLSWSAPKDATWISATNDMECRSPDDVYMLLKSSDFITHDLEHAFDDCVDEHEKGSTAKDETPSKESPFIYHLILRKCFNINPALEFRCFVRNKVLIALCQRDQNHFGFLFPMRTQLLDKIQSLLSSSLIPNFPESNFVFDVYIPPPHDRVWLIDINPWAIRTDPLLFSWLELLQMPAPEEEEESSGSEEDSQPVFRLIERDDPEAYQFSTTKFSAHKLPKDVVDASIDAHGGGMRDLMSEWQRAMDRSKSGEEDNSDSS